MSIKNMFILFCFILIIPLFLQVCSSPETPETPEEKPKAGIEINLNKSPVVMSQRNDGCYDAGFGKPKVIISGSSPN